MKITWATTRGWTLAQLRGEAHPSRDHDVLQIPWLIAIRMLHAYLSSKGFGVTITAPDNILAWRLTLPTCCPLPIHSPAYQYDQLGYGLGWTVHAGLGWQPASSPDPADEESNPAHTSNPARDLVEHTRGEVAALAIQCQEGRSPSARGQGGFGLRFENERQLQESAAAGAQCSSQPGRGSGARMDGSGARMGEDPVARLATLLQNPLPAALISAADTGGQRSDGRKVKGGDRPGKWSGRSRQGGAFDMELTGDDVLEGEGNEVPWSSDSAVLGPGHTVNLTAKQVCRTLASCLGCRWGSQCPLALAVEHAVCRLESVLASHVLEQLTACLLQTSVCFSLFFCRRSEQARRRSRSCAAASASSKSRGCSSHSRQGALQ